MHQIVFRLGLCPRSHLGELGTQEKGKKEGKGKEKRGGRGRRKREEVEKGKGREEEGRKGKGAENECCLKLFRGPGNGLARLQHAGKCISEVWS